MDARLRLIIEAYVSAINVATQHMQNHGITLQASNIEWACYQLPESVRSLKVGRVSMFRKHGFGCEVTFIANNVRQSIDFDPHGEIDGFDLWRLSYFVKRHARRSSLMSKADLEAAFEQSVVAGELVCRGQLYYLSATLT